MPAERQPALFSPTLPFVAMALLTAAVLPPLAPAKLPATPPTSQSAMQAGDTTAPLSAEPVSANHARRAQVTFTDGQLDIRAENSSLNDILYEVARTTGMKITGGVRDQRVFGHYGPAAPSDVIATLLDGTGTNMLLKESPGEAPVELVLTPRTGGPTPPSPSAPTYATDDNSPGRGPGVNPPAMIRGGLQPGRPGQSGQPPQAGQPGQPPSGSPPSGPPPDGAVASGPPAIPQPLNNPLGSPDNSTNSVSTMPTTNSVPTDTLPTPSTTTESQQGIVDSPNPPPPGTTTSGTDTTSSPNGVATPEQIYQQLLKLQQQSGSSSSGSSSTTTTPSTTTPSTTTTTPPQ